MTPYTGARDLTTARARIRNLIHLYGKGIVIKAVQLETEEYEPNG